MGQLGSTAWLYRHSKELASRALAYINLDDLIQGDDNIHVTGSPILRFDHDKFLCPSYSLKPLNWEVDGKVKGDQRISLRPCNWDWL